MHLITLYFATQYETMVSTKTVVFIDLELEIAVKILGQKRGKKHGSHNYIKLFNERFCNSLKNINNC